MNVVVLTSLYPSPQRPHEGIFAERRWLGMRARGHAVRVVHPLPWAPPFLRGPRGEMASMPRRESRSGIEIDRPRYLHVPGRARANAQRFARRGVRAVLDPGRPDVVIADYAWPAAMAAEAFDRAGVPFVVHGRGSDVLQVAGEAGLGAELGACVRKAGYWCAVSADLVGALDELGGHPGRGVLVPNGVDLERFTCGSKSEARRELGRDPERRLVLVVGHLIERKDPLLALEAFRAADLADTDLVFLGRGPLQGALEERVAALGLAQRVDLLGERGPEELARWYAAADALVLTSRREGRPNVVLEALASGRAVLATDAGGTGELLAGLPGMLSTSRDATELGASLRALVEDAPDPELLRSQVESLSWPASFEKLECVLRAAIDAEADQR